MSGGLRSSRRGLDTLRIVTAIVLARVSYFLAEVHFLERKGRVSK